MSGQHSAVQNPMGEQVLSSGQPHGRLPPGKEQQQQQQQQQEAVHARGIAGGRLIPAVHALGVLILGLS